MDREYVLTILLLAIGSLAIVAANVVRRREPAACITAERDAWRQLWTPILVAILGTAWLWGWWVREPDASEAVPWGYIAIAIVAGIACARTGLLVCTGWLMRRDTPAAYTAGWLKPRAVIDPVFAATLTDDEWQAVAAHEAAHVRHRDPLRVWLAQLCTDLQWPSRGAANRLRRWRIALEIARDDEARAAGIDGADLAHAVIAALRFASHESRGTAGLTTEETLVRARVDRLLSPFDDRPSTPGHARKPAIVWAPVFVVIALTGAAWGEAIVRVLTSW